MTMCNVKNPFQTTQMIIAQFWSSHLKSVVRHSFYQLIVLVFTVFWLILTALTELFLTAAGIYVVEKQLKKVSNWLVNIVEHLAAKKHSVIWMIMLALYLMDVNV